MVCDEIRNVSGLGDDRIAALVPDLETATRPCQRCGGTVTIWDKSHRRSAPCPNCIAGKPRVALYTTCCRADATYRDFSHPGCNRCDETGRVLVGEGTIQLAPVVSEHDYESNTSAVEITDQGLVLLHLAQHDAMVTRPIALPDGVGPGDIVIIWTGGHR
jgi:hypothetical protein